MILLSVTILALLSGPDARTPVEVRAGSGSRVALFSTAVAPGSVRTDAPARPPGRRPQSPPWTVSGVEELDTEELDETWLLQLDVIGLSDDDREAWGSARSDRAGPAAPGLANHARPRMPLRC